MKRKLKREFSNLGFDPDALREKYKLERDKRMRDDGDDQYVEMAGEFARFSDEDPYVEPGLYGLYDIAYFQTRLTELRWDEGASRWIVSTNHGEEGNLQGLELR